MSKEKRGKKESFSANINYHKDGFYRTGKHYLHKKLGNHVFVWELEQ